MGQFVPKIQEVILARMINRVVARTDLTDINDGSSLKQVLAAAAREDDDAYFQMVNLLDLFDLDKAIGADLDERAKEMNPALITRFEKAKATGAVVFSRTGTSGVVTIAIGTQVSVPAVGDTAEKVFTTITEGTIADLSSLSGSVNVVADEAGGGTVDVAAISGFVSKPSGVDFVTNPAAISNGLDRETDDAFRTRIKSSIKGLARSHIAGIEAAALAAVDPATGGLVQFAHLVEDQINRGNSKLYIDDGSGTLDANKTSVADKVVLLAAVGGETVIFLPDFAIKTEAGFTLKINTVVVPAANYTLNPATGQINFLPASFPTGLTLADTVTYTGTFWTGLIAEVQKVVDGDAGDRASYPGYRAAGTMTRVMSPSIQQQIVTANITVMSGFSQTAVATAVSNAVSAYINGLGISDDVILNELRERAMAIPGMYNLEFTAPVADTVILDTQMARLIAGNTTIT